MTKESAVLARLALAASVLAFSCAGAKPPFQFKGPPPANAPDRAMARLADQIIDASLQMDPILCSYVGYRKWDHLLPDWSPAGIEKSLAQLRFYERELAKLNGSTMSASYELDHQILTDRIAEQLFLLGELRPYKWDVQTYNEAIGGGLYYLTIPPEDPAKWPARLESLLGRIAAIPAFVATAKTNLENPPRAFTEFVIKQNPGSIDTIEKQLPPLFAPYPKLAARFEQEKPKAIAALKDFQTFLESELLPRSSGDFRLGRERWEKKLAMTLHSVKRSDEIYRSAEKRADTTRFEMYDLALPLYREMYPDDRSYLGMAGDERINKVVGSVLAKIALEHGTPESLFGDVQKYAESIKDFIRKSELITLPPDNDRFALEPTPPFLDGLAVAFFNPAPAFEPDLKKSFWISTVPKAGTADAESYLREYNHYTLQALTIHEAFPGHYVQNYSSNHSPFTSIVKQVFESGTMAEGWAVLIEELMHEAGYAKGDPKNRLFHLKMRLRVFCNAMLDAKLHTSSGDEAELDRWAMKLMLEKGFQEEAEASRKLRRAKLTSTQLSTYFVGYEEMRAIYDAARTKAGAGAKPRPILEKMISYGTIPPALIEKAMKAQGAL